MRRITIVLAGTAAAAVFAGSAISVTMPRVSGSVGPGPTITLKQGAKKVATLKAGRYSFVISDKATTHNFHLTGPGVNKSTSVPRTGSQTWTLTLRKGTYRFVCDPHASFMKGSFKVT